MGCVESQEKKGAHASSPTAHQPPPRRKERRASSGHGVVAAPQQAGGGGGGGGGRAGRSEGRGGGRVDGGGGGSVNRDNSADGRRLGGGGGEGDLRSNVAAAALARQTAKPAGITAEKAKALQEARERDELIGRINAVAERLREEVPLAIRARETPLSKLRSYKQFLEEKEKQRKAGR